jgi:TDG/mug DNA glycosylase family protein
LKAGTPGELRDRLAPGIRVMFVGINPGMRSAATGHHFAGFSNRFWKLLFDARLVPEPLTAFDDHRLPEFGYGITNLVARATPGISDLTSEDYAAGRRRLVAKIRRHRPKVVALVGVTLYRVLFPKASGNAKVRPNERAGEDGGSPTTTLPHPLGPRLETLGGVGVFVLPNPSGRNANYSYGEMLAAFEALREAEASRHS